MRMRSLIQPTTPPVAGWTPYEDVELRKGIRSLSDGDGS
jgi:hypothetical protein